MLEAIVGVALRAILASVILGGGLMLGVLAATRLLALTATTRHALWTTALLATALMPPAGIGVSVARGFAAPPNAVHDANRVVVVLPAPAAATHDAAPKHDVHAQTPVRTSDLGSAAADRPVQAAPALASARELPRAFAAWTPRLSRTLALGIIGVWLLGALAGTIGLLASVARVRGLKKRSSPLDGTLADELPWLTEIGAGREVYLRLSYETETPVAIGFRRPVILIPTELANADGLAAIESLVLHEYAHLQRYDDWTNLAQRAIERIFWFNPVLWLLGRRIALEREIASDDAVVEKTGAAREYATSLWRLAREMRMPEHAVVAPGALLTRKQISIRIEQLLDKNRARLHRSPVAAAGVVLAGTLAVAFVATSAPAVELPAAPAPATAWVTGTTAPPVTADPLTDQKIAELESQFGAASGDAAAHAGGAPKQRIEIVQENRSTVVSAPHAAVRAGAPTARASKHHAAASLTTTTVKITQIADAIPSMPAMPREPLPSLAPLHRSLHVMMHVPRSTGPGFVGSEIGSEIASAVRDSIAALPAQVAQEMSGAPRAERSLRNAKLSRELIAACTGCSLSNADLRGLDLHGITLNGDNLAGADLRGVNLAGARLIGVSLAHANLAAADLRGAQLNGVELHGANFDGAQLDDVKLIGVSMRHVSLHGTVLRSVISNCTGCDFSGMDLHGQDLHGITLNGADLSHADLHDANLSNVRFSGVALAHANLAGADLTGASLNGCELGHVNLHGAKTTGMTMSGSGFDG